MDTSDKVSELLENFQDSKEVSFAHFIASTMSDKVIELYTGDDFEQVSTDQSSFSKRAVIVGKVLGAVKKFIILDCYSTDSAGLQSGNVVFINTHSIIALKLFNSTLPLSNVFIKSSRKTHGTIGK